MQTWTEPELVMAPDEADDRQTRAEGGRCSHFYNMSAFRYGSQWLGLVTHFRYMGPPSVSGPEQSGQDGPIDVQLVHSRDGRHWNRSEDRSPVIPNGPYDYDAGCILGVANQPIVTGDEVWMYYSAITTTHGGYIPKKQISIARAAWRLDGWCSLHAGEAGGVIETVPLRPEGDRLTVNAAASGGAVAVAVLDASGNPVAGYGDPDCTPLKRDDVRQPVRWKNRDGLPLERPIRLRFACERDSSLPDRVGELSAARPHQKTGPPFKQALAVGRGGPVRRIRLTGVTSPARLTCLITGRAAVVGRRWQSSGGGDTLLLKDAGARVRGS